MTDAQRKAIKEAIRRQTIVNTRSKEAAMAAMIRNGFYGSDGKLTPEYGGSPRGRSGKRRASADLAGCRR